MSLSGPALSRPAWSMPASQGAQALDEGAAAALAPIPSEDRFEVGNDLGVGGMGRVRLVRDRWLNRLVAVKEPVTEVEARRLWREALVTARLEHPGIVPVYDLGLGPSGTPWFAMRVVRGRSLAELLREGGPGHHFLRPLLAACEAIGFAHRLGVVHRDVKPANLMIGPFGEMQVIDWGLAQCDDLPQRDRGSSGTRGYMSPEQARGEAVKPSSDVWSLGVVLREALGADPPRTLATIIDRCLAPEPGARYPDAKALAEELERYLDGRRVAAHEYTLLETLGRLYRRWRLPILVGLVGLVLLVVGAIVGVSRIRSERDVAEANLGVLLAREAGHALRDDRVVEAVALATDALARPIQAPIAAEARGILAGLGPELPHATIVQEVAGTVVEIAGDAAYTLDEGELTRWTGGVARWSSAATAEAVVVALADAVAVLEGEDLQIIGASGEPRARLHDPCGAAFGPRLGRGADGSLWASNRRCFVHVLATGAVGDPVEPCGLDGLHFVTGHPDGRRVAAACGDGSLALWDGARLVRVDAKLGTPTTPPMPTALAWHGDDLLHGAADGRVERLILTGDGVTGVTRIPLARQAGLVRSIELTPDQHHALVLADASAPLVLDLLRDSVALRLVAAPTPVARPEAGGILATRLLGDTTRIVRWSGVTPRPRHLPFPDGVTRVAVLPDGTIAIGDGARLVFLDTERRVVGADRWQDSIIKTLAVTPTGALLAHGQGDFSLRQYRDGELVAAFRMPATLVRRMAPLADGSVVIADYSQRRYRVWLERAWEALPEVGPLRDLAAAPDGSRYLVLTTDGTVWSGDPSGVEEVIGVEAEARALAMDGERIALMEDDAVEVLGAGGTLEARHEVSGAELASIAAAHGHVAAGGRDGRVWVWRADGTELVLRAHEGRVDSLAFGWGGERLVTGGWDGRARFLDFAGLAHDRTRLQAALGPVLGNAGVSPGED